MSDLLIFVAIVAIMVVGGFAVGMIVAGRIDRIQAQHPAVRPDDTPSSREDPE